MYFWSAEEVAVLKENYSKISNEELCSLIPNKSFLGIYKKARKMGLKKTRENKHLNRSLARKGEKGANWKGGKRRTNKGYVQVLCPEHERADKSGYVMEHI